MVAKAFDYYKKSKVLMSISHFALKAFLTSLFPPDIRKQCRALLGYLGIEIEVKGSLPDNCLIVANHLSYLDIPILATLRPMVFVTSYEVRDAKATGFFAKLGGAIFVERRNYSTLLDDIEKIRSLLREGHTVCLFPEATTSSGRMLPWKSSLLEASLGYPVVPIAIKYLEVNGEKVCDENKSLLYYYGMMDFSKHLKTLVSKVKSAKVKVSILAPLLNKKSRKALTAQAREAVSKEL